MEGGIAAAIVSTIFYGSVILLFLSPILLIAVAVYVVNGISLMKIAKKLGVPGGFMGFIPGACDWLLGRLAEEDDRIYHPEKKGVKWSVWYLVTLGVYMELLVTGDCLVYFASIFGTLSEGAPQQTALVILCFMLIGLLIMLAALVIYYVVFGIVFYKIYHAMAGMNAVWMLILSLFVPFAQQIILLVLAFSDKYPVFMPEEAVAVQDGVAEQTIEEN